MLVGLLKSVVADVGTYWLEYGGLKTYSALSIFLRQMIGLSFSYNRCDSDFG